MTSVKCLERSKHPRRVDIRMDSNNLRYSVLKGYWNKEHVQPLWEMHIELQQVVQLKTGTLIWLQTLWTMQRIDEFCICLLISLWYFSLYPLCSLMKVEQSQLPGHMVMIKGEKCILRGRGFAVYPEYTHLPCLCSCWPWTMNEKRVFIFKAYCSPWNIHTQPIVCSTVIPADTSWSFFPAENLNLKHWMYLCLCDTFNMKFTVCSHLACIHSIWTKI